MYQHTDLHLCLLGALPASIQEPASSCQLQRCELQQTEAVRKLCMFCCSQNECYCSSPKDLFPWELYHICCCCLLAWDLAITPDIELKSSVGIIQELRTICTYLGSNVQLLNHWIWKHWCSAWKMLLLKSLDSHHNVEKIGCSSSPISSATHSSGIRVLPLRKKQWTIKSFGLFNGYIINGYIIWQWDLKVPDQRDINGPDNIYIY